jgi:hypothetical protein
VFTKVERLFMLGLRAPDPALRRKFSALYARAVAATMYDRLNFVVVQQDWQAMAHQVGAARQGGAGQGGAQRGGAWRGRGGGAAGGGPAPPLIPAFGELCRGRQPAGREFRGY